MVTREPAQRVVFYLRKLPFGMGDNNITKYNYLGFDIPIRWKSHEEMGDAFILCSPARNWLYLGNPDDITAMLKRSADFPHDSELTAMLGIFGPNISTVSQSLFAMGHLFQVVQVSWLPLIDLQAQGTQWKKMRKLIGSCLLMHDLVVDTKTVLATRLQ